MTIIEAVKSLKKFRRSSWPGNIEYIFVDGSMKLLTTSESIYKGFPPIKGLYAATADDILADDWTEVA